MKNYDEDLFEYDPDLEETPKTFSSHQESVTPLTKEEETFFKEVTDSSNLISELSGNLNSVNISFAQSFQITLEEFISTRISSSSFYKTTVEYLDHLSEGKFSLLHFKNNLEMVISRSLHVLNLTKFLYSEVPFLSSSMQELLNSMDLKTNPLYFKTCFHSTINILQHKLLLDRQLYNSVCSDLSIDPNPILFLEPADFVMQDQSESFEISNFKDDIFSKINSYLYESTDFLTSINDLFPGKNVSF